MHKITTQLSEIKLVGITARTNNAAEMNPAIAKIGATIQQYFHNAIPGKILHRKKSWTTYCVYTDYESDLTGDYTYFIGEEVTSFDNQLADLSQLIIPAQQYKKFTDGPGVMPEVCINMWQKIWQMTPEELGSEREYLADFEVYDERAQDPQSTTLDIYIGVKPV